MKLIQKVDGIAVTLTQQIASVERELNMRRNCYPRWIEKGTMSKSKADDEIRNMTAVLQTLKDFKEENEERGIGL